MYKIVALRVDFGGTIGFGHLFRMINLSKYLLNNKFKVILISSRCNKIKFLSKKIILENKIKNFYDILNILRKHNCNTLISDISHIRNLRKKNFFLKYNIFFKKRNIKTISFDDPSQFCSSNISIIPYPCKSIKIKKLKTTQILKGIEYSIIKEDCKKKKKKKFFSKTRNILVILGGNPSEKILRNIIITISKIDHPRVITKIFIGHIKKKKFKYILKNKKKKKIFILFNKFENIQKLYSWSDFVIVGQGLSKIEAVAYKKPGFFTNNINQNGINKKLIKDFNDLNLLKFVEASEFQNHQKIAKDLKGFLTSRKKIIFNLRNFENIKFNKSLDFIRRNV